MTQNIYLLAFGTFGNPYGFRQTFFKVANENVAKSIKTFDLNTNAIKLFQNTTIYSIRKEIANGINSVAYSKYTFAKEQNSDRGGTFIGASIYFTNEIAQENLTINKLHEFHKILVAKNVVDETIMVNHSDKFSVDLPQDFDKLGFNLKKFDELINFNLSNTNLVVFSRINENTLQQNFKKSLELLNIYDTIFFTDSKEIVDFTKSRDIYKVIDENGYDKEIQTLRDEKKKKLQILVSDFEKELSELDEKKRISIRDFKDSIEENSRLHQENNRKIEDDKKQINIIENKYYEFSKKIKEAINLIDTNNNIEVVKSFHNENKREFINYINQNIKPTYLNRLNDIQARTNLTANNQRNLDWTQTNNEKSNNEQSKKRKPFKIFKLVSFIFFALWLVTIIYYQAFQIPEKNKIIQDYEYQINQNITEDDSEEKTIDSQSTELNPKSNNQLNQNDIKNIAKSIKSDMNITEVVKIIFEKNPTDIKKHYENQIDLYSKKIIELNKNCFEEKNGNNYYKQDTIKNIPSFKSEN